MRQCLPEPFCALTGDTAAVFANTLFACLSMLSAATFSILSMVWFTFRSSALRYSMALRMSMNPSMLGLPGRVNISFVNSVLEAKVLAWHVDFLSKFRLSRADLPLYAFYMTLFQDFLTDKQGQDLIEYTLLMAFVALASAAISIQAGSSISGIWGATSTQLSNANSSAS
jgi:Flp pilus assembly pilin Flp